MAVISSGDQDGPHPPEKQSEAEGTSKTSTMTGLGINCSFYPIRHAPPAHTRTQTAQPEHFSSMTVYPFAPG